MQRKYVKGLISRNLLDTDTEKDGSARGQEGEHWISLFIFMSIIAYQIYDSVITELSWAGSQCDTVKPTAFLPVLSLSFGLIVAT